MTEAFIAPRKNTLHPADAEEDEEQHYTSIAFDPGGTTGWSVMAVHPDAIDNEEYNITDNIVFWSAGEFVGSEDDMADQMADLAEAWEHAKIVCEDFVLRKFSSSRELLSPVRVFSKFEHRLWMLPRRRPIIWQPSSLAMSTITDQRLQKMGLYAPLVGKEHARDAVRHNLTWLRRAKQMALKKKVADALIGASHGGDGEA